MTPEAIPGARWRITLWCAAGDRHQPVVRLVAAQRFGSPAWGCAYDVQALLACGHRGRAISSTANVAAMRAAVQEASRP